MVRIFLSLAVVAVVLLAANLLLGLALGDLGESSRAYAIASSEHRRLTEQGAPAADLKGANQAREEALRILIASRRQFQPHIWLGIASSLVAVLVNCISVTYFVGTSRWCREVVEAYRLDWELVERGRRLKRRSFPFAVLGMLTVVAIVALGGAADPGGSAARAADWVIPHLVAALVGLAVIVAAFAVQVRLVGANFQLIQEIMLAAQQVRKGVAAAEASADSAPLPAESIG